MVMCLSSAFDLMNPVLADHHKRVAFIASGIGRTLGMSDESVGDLVIAGLLHDVGAFSLRDRLEIQRFEEHTPGNHAEVGYRFAREFKPFEKIADIIRFHHYPWDDGGGARSKANRCPTPAIYCNWPTGLPSYRPEKASYWAGAAYLLTG
jgi:putative nucleotidyltransferase with HDIG domain